MMGFTVDQAPLQTPVPLHSPLQKCSEALCWWWFVWLLALFLRLHFSVFSSSPRALIIPPTRKCCSGGLSMEPSQEHKSSFIAFYRLLHHRKCRVECTEMVTESLFFFSYWLFTNNSFAHYYHQLAGVCNDRFSSLADFSFSLSHNFMEVRSVHYLQKKKKRKFNISSQSMLFHQTS